MEQNFSLVAQEYILVAQDYILGAQEYILGPQEYILLCHKDILLAQECIPCFCTIVFAPFEHHDWMKIGRVDAENQGASVWKGPRAVRAHKSIQKKEILCNQGRKKK